MLFFAFSQEILVRYVKNLFYSPKIEVTLKNLYIVLILRSFLHVRHYLHLPLSRESQPVQLLLTGNRVDPESQYRKKTLHVRYKVALLGRIKKKDGLISL